MSIAGAADALADLERVVAAVQGEQPPTSKVARALATQEALSRHEGIPMAVVGGLAAIHHGYQGFTKDIDVVVAPRPSFSGTAAGPTSAARSERAGC